MLGDDPGGTGRHEPSAPGSAGLIPWILTAGITLSGALSSTGTVVSLLRSSEVRYVGGWTATESVLLDPSPTAAPRPVQSHGTESASTVRTLEASRSSEADPAAAVRRLYAISGLTWDQLAKLFGVSRRAVHHWASGGRMNASHAEALGLLARRIGSVSAASAEERRALLLLPHSNGPSIYDELRETFAARGEELQPSLAARARLAADDAAVAVEQESE
jgi:transcriptional regulator with XRE-family HTH domain